MLIACPPSERIACSKLTRVRKLGFSNKQHNDRPASKVGSGHSRSLCARSRIETSRSNGVAEIVRKCRNRSASPIRTPPATQKNQHNNYINTIKQHTNTPRRSRARTLSNQMDLVRGSAPINTKIVPPTHALVQLPRQIFTNPPFRVQKTKQRRPEFHLKLLAHRHVGKPLTPHNQPLTRTQIAKTPLTNTRPLQNRMTTRNRRVTDPHITILTTTNNHSLANIGQTRQRKSPQRITIRIADHKFQHHQPLPLPSPPLPTIPHPSHHLPRLPHIAWFIRSAPTPTDASRTSPPKTNHPSHRYHPQTRRMLTSQNWGISPPHPQPARSPLHRSAIPMPTAPIQRPANAADNRSTPHHHLPQ